MDECGSKNSALFGDYYMLKCTDSPSVIVECGFMSNTEDDKLLADEEFQRAIAYAIFKSTVEGLASTRWAAVRMAGGVFMTFFPTLLFIIFQEQLTDGALTSGIKG